MHVGMHDDMHAGMHDGMYTRTAAVAKDGAGQLELDIDVSVIDPFRKPHEHIYIH